MIASAVLGFGVAFELCEVPDRAAMLGMLLIIAGCVVINTFSKSVAH